MNKIYSEKMNLNPEILRWFCDTLEEISDEVGTEKKGKYLLVYEGWSGLCVSKAFDSTKSNEKNEDAYYKFAEKHSGVVIDEWIKKYEDYFSLIGCGHEPTSLYGVTWALFKEYTDKTILKNCKRNKKKKKYIYMNV